MRAGPAIRSSFFVLSASSVLGTGCLLDASAYDSAGAAGTTTTSSTASGGSTTTTTPSGGGGTGGMTTTTTGGVGGTGGGGATGGGGTGGVTTPFSCKDALAKGVTTSGVVTIDPVGVDPEMDVYCDQTNMGGGWALVYSSVADPAGGTTTAFWHIPYAQRFDVIAPQGLTPTKTCYAGKLYNYGTEYRDDVVDQFNVEVIGALHATANGINVSTMHFTMPKAAADNLSDDIFKAHFANGWSSPDHDDDGEPDHNAAVYWGNVTQHYAADSLWSYNLGTDRDPNNPGQQPPDFTDGGWGPHLLDNTINQINAALPAPQTKLSKDDGDPSSSASRVNRITRWARW